MERTPEQQRVHDRIQAYVDADAAKWEQMKRDDRKAAFEKQYVGRVLRHPFADNFAYYRVVRENYATVGIQVVKDYLDGWQLPAWGERTTIPKRLADRFLVWPEHGKYAA